MSGSEPDKQPDTNSAEPADRGETVGLMEPLLIGERSRHRTALTDLAVDLAARSAGFRRSLSPGVLTALADLMRAMNCYYSNLIKGHDTHPLDIERAQERLQHQHRETEPPARSQGAYFGPEVDRRRRSRRPRHHP